ncbi:peroxiredoxin family protein [Nocardia tengchongensis]|uniref:peroxiredoxin family protein n=1 Tax=Nocardia tengchongensis TaxID=2055889 RepID=UPI00369FABFC
MLTIESAVPNLELVDTTGQSWRLSDDRDVRGTLLYFMRSTSCPICNLHVRDLVARRTEFDDAKIRVVIVVPEDRTAGHAWKTDRGIPFPVLTAATGSAHESVGLTRRVFGTMQQSGTVLVDSDGIVRHAHGSTLPTAGYDKKGIAAAVHALRDSRN